MVIRASQILASLPDYLVKPSFTTQQQRQTKAMEAQIAEILERMRGIDEIKELQMQQGNDFLDLKGAIDAWKPEMENSVAQLQAAVRGLQCQMEGVLKVPIGAGAPPTTDGPEFDQIRELGWVATPPTTTGPIGRREDLLPRGKSAGVLSTPTSPPANGEHLRSPPPLLPTPFQPSSSFQPRSEFSFQGREIQFMSGGTPQNFGGNTLNTYTQFPCFDGSNPKLWHTRCTDYFEMYEVHSSNWVRLALMHFIENAALWLQSAERRLRRVSWSDFAALVIQKFGHDQHQTLIRQFYHVRQSTTVAECVEQFESIMNQLLSYSENIDPLYFTTRFVDGLRVDLCAAVLIQRPPDLESAVALAYLQEEVDEMLPRREVRWLEPTTSKPIPRSAPPLPLPAPPVPRPTPVAACRGDDPRVSSRR